MMASDSDYIQVLPDYAYDDGTSKTASKQPYNAAADDDDVSSQVKSRDMFTVTSLYEHPQPSESGDCGEQRSAYQRVITSQRLDSGEHLHVITSDETYDVIADIPAPPPPRQDANQFRGVQVVQYQQQLQQQPQQQQQQQQVSSNIVYVQVPASGVRPRWTGQHYLHTQSKCIGAILVIVGSLSMIGNILSGAVTYWIAGYLCRCIFCSLMFVFSGGFGIGAGISRTKCNIKTFTVLSIFTILSSLIQILTAAILLTDADCASKQCNEVWLAMEAAQLIESVTAAVACIWGSAVGCHGICSCCYSNDNTNYVPPMQTMQYPVAGDVNMASPPHQHMTSQPPAPVTLVRGAGMYAQPPVTYVH